MKIGAHGYADAAFRPATRAEARRRRRLFALILIAAMIALAALGVGHLVQRRGFPSADPRNLTAGSMPLADPTRMVVSDPQELRPVSARDARAINAARPNAGVENPAALPLAVPFRDAASFGRSLQCMTAAIYYEAANEPVDGQRAVAQVVLNRIRHPAFPATVCGVVYQGAARPTGCQFSFTCDGSEARVPAATGWARARQVALAALAGYVYRPVGLSTFYHADYVSPYWAPSLLKVVTLGRHIFYRWGGGLGAPRAFTGRYAGEEPEILRNPAIGQDPVGGPIAVYPLGDNGPASLASRPVLGQAGKPMGSDAPVSGGEADAGTRAGTPAPPSAAPRARFVLGMTGAAGPDADARTPPRPAAVANPAR